LAAAVVALEPKQGTIAAVAVAVVRFLTATV
jgi:hypothetical protein